MGAPRKYPAELRERALRLYRESEPKPVIRKLAEQLGIHHEALRTWIRQDQADHGERFDRPPPPRSRNCAGCAVRTQSSSASTRCCGRPALISPRRSARPEGGRELHRRT